MGRTCRHCGIALARASSFCSTRCRMRAYRRRRALGVDHEADFPEGARRGRVAMGDLTTAERIAATLEALGPGPAA